ncbi:sensor histidine kinase [Mangrovibacter sp. SLW1]
MALAAQTRNQRLQVEPLTGLPAVSADMGMIERVLTNLLDNAIRHTPEGTTISVRAWQEVGEMILEVADNGPGIPQEKRNHLFTRPALLKGESLSRGGLGLMVVHQILQLHGSRIELVSQQGACFRFTLPLVA